MYRVCIVSVSTCITVYRGHKADTREQKADTRGYSADTCGYKFSTFELCIRLQEESVRRDVGKKKEYAEFVYIGDVSMPVSDIVSVILYPGHGPCGAHMGRVRGMAILQTCILLVSAAWHDILCETGGFTILKPLRSCVVARGGVAARACHAALLRPGEWRGCGVPSTLRFTNQST